MASYGVREIIYRKFDRVFMRAERNTIQNIPFRAHAKDENDALQIHMQNPVNIQSINLYSFNFVIPEDTSLCIFTKLTRDLCA